jgi:hypothetical protein
LYITYINSVYKFSSYLTGNTIYLRSPARSHYTTEAVYILLHNIYKFSSYLTGNTIHLRSLARNSDHCTTVAVTVPVLHYIELCNFISVFQRKEWCSVDDSGRHEPTSTLDTCNQPDTRRLHCPQITAVWLNHGQGVVEGQSAQAQYNCEGIALVP